MGDQAGAGERVVLLLCDEMPAQHGHLAGGRDGRDLEPAPGLDAAMERPQRTGGPRRAEGGFDEHPSGLCPAGFGDPAVAGGAVAGLVDLGVQAQVGHEAVRGLEAGEVPDRGHDRGGHGDVDARNGHQPGDHRVPDGVGSDVALDQGELVAGEVELAQQRVDAALLISGQRLSGEPATADAAEHVRVRACRHQVARQDGVHLVLEPGPLAHQMGPARHQPAPHPGPLVSHPRLGQEIGREELREDAGVDLVGLDLRLSDRSGLARVRHHNPGHDVAQHHRDRIRVRRCLQGDLVAGLAELRCPLAQVLGTHPDPALVAHQPVLDNGDLRERTMHIHPDMTHHS